MTLEPR